MPSVLSSLAKPSLGLQRVPLEYSGSLDQYESFDLTSSIGREYPKVQVKNILDDDEKVRDLAILSSERGVLFFRNQDITIEQLKILTNKLGKLAGRPRESGVRIQS